MVDWGRFELMPNFLKGENIGLVASRLNRQASLGYFFVTKKITDFHILDSAADSTSAFPLYLYRDDGSRTPNFDIGTLKVFTQKLREPYEPEDILDYIYAVLHSPTYRETYKEFLKIDFPRVPCPKDDTSFRRFVVLGRELRSLHLMESPKLRDFITTFPVSGTNEVEKLRFVIPAPSVIPAEAGIQNPKKSGRVYINASQYFGDVPEVAWNFFIGGYQPARKWLKDRKGRTLTNEDIEHYQKIIVALTETGRIMIEIG